MPENVLSNMVPPAAGGIAGSLTAEQNAAQSFTANTDTVLVFGNITDDAFSGWDAVNHRYSCDATLAGAYAQMDLNTEMNGGVASGSLMKLQLQYSNNGGTNWVAAGADIGSDFFGTKSITSLLKVQTGTLIRARATFFGNARASWGNSGVNMKIVFIK